MIPAALLAIGGKILDRVIPDPAARDEAKAKMAELAAAGEFKELEHVEKMYGLEVDDRKSAREMAKADGGQTQRNLAYGVVTFWGAAQLFLLFKGGNDLDPVVLARILGMLDAAVLCVLYFFFGSSHGSKTKDLK